MTGARIRALVVFLMMVSAAVLAHLMTPTEFLADKLGKPDLETLFPKEFANWKLDARAAMVLPSPETQALLNSIYNQTLTRTYINSSGYRIMLSVAYGGDQSDGTRAHLPERCYPAQGFQISTNVEDRLAIPGKSLPVRHLMASQGLRKEPITYWLVVGDQVTISRTDQKLAQFRLGLQGLIPDGMLVRVSSIDPDMAQGQREQAAFLADLAAAVSRNGFARIFGARP